MKKLRIDGEVFDLSEICKALKETEEDVELTINSPGGDVFAGLQVVKAIENCKHSVTAKIEVMAASIAAVIALACNKVIIGKNDLMMLHNCWTFTAGNKEQLQKDIDAMTAIDKVLHNIIGEHCTDKELNAKVDAGDVWLVGEEVVEKFDHSEMASESAEMKLAAVASLAALVKKARAAETEEERKRKKKRTNVPPQPEPEPDPDLDPDPDPDPDDQDDPDNPGGGDNTDPDTPGGDDGNDPDNPDNNDDPDAPPAEGNGEGSDTPPADAGGGEAPAPSGYVVPDKLKAMLAEAAALE